MTPTAPFNSGGCCGNAVQQIPAPGSTPILPPQLIAGNLTYLPPGSFPTFNIRDNPLGGYFLDFGLPEAPPGMLTLNSAAELFAAMVPANGTYRVVTDNNGTRLEVWNSDQNTFQTVIIRGAPGQETLSILQPDA